MRLIYGIVAAVDEAVSEPINPSSHLVEDSSYIKGKKSGMYNYSLYRCRLYFNSRLKKL